MQLSCNNCEEQLNVSLSCIPTKWRNSIVYSLCKILEGKPKHCSTDFNIYLQELPSEWRKELVILICKIFTLPECDVQCEQCIQLTKDLIPSLPFDWRCAILNAICDIATSKVCIPIPPLDPPCDIPTSVSYTFTSPNTLVFNWSGSNTNISTPNYNWSLKSGNSVVIANGSTINHTVTITNNSIIAGNNYTFSVQQICVNGLSDFNNYELTIPVPCEPPTNVVVTLINGVYTATWDGMIIRTDDPNFNWVTIGNVDPIDPPSELYSGSTIVGYESNILPSFIPGHTYTFQVQQICVDNTLTDFTSVEFTAAIICPAPQNLIIS